MGGCSGLPGVILITAATVLLALVSFNTPSLKSLYFFEAHYSSGNLAGTLRLGTLGYCLTRDGAEKCVGPQVGYNLDLNTLFNIKQFNIPSAVSKWMTYTLILHVVGLAAGGVGVIAGLLDMIPGFNMICFPTCLAGICGTVTLIALIFDLAMFFLLKASVGRVSGATGNIGMCVWMTLAAWLLACFAGCAYGLGRCCCDCGGGGSRRDRKRDRERDAELDTYNRRDEELRLTALQNEHRRQQEQGLPSFPEMERMPLTSKQSHEDKYLYDEPADHIPSVGAGYGRREPHAVAATHPADDQFDYNYNYGLGPSGQAGYGGGYEPSVTTAGAAGLGAGAAGVVPAAHTYGSYDDYGYSGQGYDAHGGQGGAYSDPYAQHQQDPYAPQPHQSNNYDSYYTQPYSNTEYATPTYPPQAAVPGGAAGIAGGAAVAAGAAAAGAAAAGTAGGYDHYRNHANLAPGNTATNYTTASSESAYPNDPVVQHGETYQSYGHDDGLGAIGRAVTSPSEAQYPADRTATYISTDSAYSTHTSRAPTMSPPQQTMPLQPRPQHLRQQNAAEQLLASSEEPAHGSDLPPSYTTASDNNASNSYRPMEKGRPV